EFETFAELRDDIETRLREQIEDEVEAEFRVAVADALVAASKVDASGPLVEARGVQLETYLSMSGQTPDQLIERLRDEATRSVARELVLEAAAEQLGIEVPDEEIELLVREQAEAFGDDPDEAIAKLHEG